MNIVVYCAAFLLSFQAFASFSTLVQETQEKYANAYTGHPIIIFNQDVLEYRYAKKKLFGTGKEKEIARAHVVQEYVKETIGLDIALNHAISLEPYTSVLKKGAYALPLKESSDQKGYLLCAVFPASANSNKRLDTTRILGLDTPGVHEDKVYERLREKLSFKELQLFSLYHELGHCMDKTFMPKNYGYYQPESHDIHLSESFAEVMGLFLLEREGIKDTGRTRAILRNYYSRVMGGWFVHQTDLLFANPYIRDTGAIYYLSPSLLRADTFLGRKSKFVATASMDEIDQAVVDIVNETAFDSRTMHAVSLWLEKGDEAIDDYVKKANRYPNFFKKTLEELLGFVYSSSYVLEETLLPEAPFEETVFSAVFDESDSCAAFLVDDEEALLEKLAAARTELRQAQDSDRLLEQKNYQDSLNNFFENLSGKCL